VRLLVVNFAMDRHSPVLAWQHSVVARLAARCERLVVLTERTGILDLPAHVDVRAVPRVLTTPLRLLGARWLMNLPVWRWCARERFDAVFVHMNADWVYRLAPCWRRFHLPVLLWYAHGTVTGRLHRAHRHATCVVTSTPEGFGIPSEKVRVIGQGIDLDLFTPPTSRTDTATIVAVGRVSRRKSVDLMLDTMSWLRDTVPHCPFRLRVIGPTLTRDDVAYAVELTEIVRRRGLTGRVSFEGPQPMHALPAIYGTAFLHLNLSQTGSMDKAILESLACGCPTLTSNQSVFPLLGAFPELLVRDRSPQGIGAQISAVYQRRDAMPPGALRALVLGHGLASYTDRVWNVLDELAARPAA